MRTPSLLAAALIAFSTLAHADTILAGSDLSSVIVGTGICSGSANCQVVAQQFTVFSPVVIDEVKIILTGPYLSSGSSDGSFSLGLGTTLGSVPGSFPINIGSGALVFNPKDPQTQEEFDFSGLNISLDAGTYFIGLTGGNILWDQAPALTNTPGAIGPEWSCDPSLNCSNGRWDGPHSFIPQAIEISGTAITPEPTSIALFGTGLLGFAEMARRRFSKAGR